MSEFYDYLMTGRINEAMGGFGEDGNIDAALKHVSDWAKRVGAKNPDEAIGMLKAAASIAQAVKSPLFMSLFHDHPLPSAGSYDNLGYKTPPAQAGGTGI